MNNIYINICKNGKYFNPAKNHYQKDCIVICDRCSKENLEECIGFEKQDLCISCVNYLIKKFKINKKSLFYIDSNIDSENYSDHDSENEFDYISKIKFN